MGAPARILSSRVFYCAVVLGGMFACSTAWAQAGACVGGPCVPTYHNDAARDGVQSQESILSPSLFPSPTTANFGLLVPAAGGATGAVDGLIYAQPLYLSNVTMASASCSGSQNIVLVATENNSVYAFTWTYSLTTTGYSFSLIQCWQLNLNQAGEFPIPFTSLPVNHSGTVCNNLMPQVGISSTPVIDTSVTPPVMYVVTGDQTASLTYTYRLHAINLNSGTEVSNGTSAPYDLSGVFHPGISAINENQRAGLALFTTPGGNPDIYVVWGSFCDTFPYSGYVAGLTYNYTTQTFAPDGTNWVFDTENGATRQDGGIWMSGAAPAVDSAGNVYVSVGNGTWNGTKEFGQSVVKLATTSSGLAAVDYYTPNDYANLNANTTSITLCSAYGLDSCPVTNWLELPAQTSNLDLGAGGVTLIAPQGVTAPVCGLDGMLVAGGKEGVIYDLCYSTEADATLESVMGGLDGCGYGCKNFSNPTISACTESSTPGPGVVAQCFQGVNAGEDQKNGSNNIYGQPGIRGPEAFWAGSASQPENYLYVAGTNTAMVAYQANTTTSTFNVTGYPEQVPRIYPFPGPVPVVSWDGANSNTALLWTIDTGSYGSWQPLSGISKPAGPDILVVYNAIPSGKKLDTLNVLWESTVGTGNAGPGAVKFTVPTVAGGLVFVGGGAPGYAPGLPGGTNVNCTAAVLVNTTTPTVCGGLLSIYGKKHS